MERLVLLGLLIDGESPVLKQGLEAVISQQVGGGLLVALAGGGLTLFLRVMLRCHHLGGQARINLTSHYQTLKHAHMHEADLWLCLKAP